LQIDTVLASPQSADHLVDQLGRGVGDAHTEADAGAHRLLALAHRGCDGLLMLGIDRAGLRKPTDELVDRFPPIPRRQLRHDVFRTDDVAQGHKRIPIKAAIWRQGRTDFKRENFAKGRRP